MNFKTRKTVPRLLPHIFCGGLFVSLTCFAPTTGVLADTASAAAGKKEGISLHVKSMPHAANVYEKEGDVFSAPVAIRVSGQVISEEDGMGMPGVTVMVKGTATGTTTDLEGNYAIEVPSAESVLVFSSIGFVTQEVPVNGRTTLNISLEPDLKQLEEVVVVGYGIQKKTDLTGAVANIGGEEIAERGTVNPLQAVQGQVAGVDISTGSGRAGAGFEIQIRGQNSLAGGEPLFVVDGVIVDGIDFINPQDIESLNILKDASSTAIYGSRGSNGVVIVTTKQGANVEGTSISYEGYAGVRQNARVPDFMSGDQWWEYRQNAYITGYLQNGEAYDATTGGLASSPTLRARVANRDYYDWQGAFLQTGIQQNHWLTISGISNDKLSYVIGAGYQEEKGNLMKEWFNRYNFKASVNHQISDRWEAGTNFNFSMIELERGSGDAIKQAYRMAPLVTPYDSAGELILRPGKYGDIGFTSSVNPLLDMANSEDNSRRLYGVGNLFLQYSPLEWLSVRTTFSPEVEFERRGLYWGSLTEERGGEDPAAYRETEQSFSYIWDNTLTATQEFEDHSFNFTGLYSIQYDRWEDEFIDVINLPYNSLYYNLGSAGDIVEVGSGYGQRSLMSYMGRLNYVYNDKYLLTLSNRWDGSSVLAQGYRWSSFPSVAIGWRASEETFLQDLDFLYDLKARLSYGFTGNNNIDPYSTLALAGDRTLYNFGDQVVVGFPPGGIVNQALTWERTRELNFGIDYGLFRGRISGSVDLYNKLSNRLLMERDLPLESGWEELTDNVGSVRNTGIELFLQTYNIQTSDFTWSTTFNFAKNNNEIVDLLGGDVNQLIGEDDDGNPYAWFVGEPINVNYNYVFDGIWQESERELALKYGQSPGQAKVADLDNNGIIDGEDRQIIGSRAPSWTGGFSTAFTFKQFDLSASLFARQGIQVFSPFHEEFLNFGDRGRAKLDVPYYMPANDVTRTMESNEYPQPKNEGQYWEEVGFYKDASFVKVQNIALGYTFGQENLDRLNMQNLRIYMNIVNPFVFTEYDGFDPEWADEDLNDTGNSFVTYQLGVNVTF